MKPDPCRYIGCSGASCKYYQATETWPYFMCRYFPSEKKERDDGERREEK